MTGRESDQEQHREQVSRMWIPPQPPPSPPGLAAWGSTQKDFRGHMASRRDGLEEK